MLSSRFLVPIHHDRPVEWSHPLLWARHPDVGLKCWPQMVGSDLPSGFQRSHSWLENPPCFNRKFTSSIQVHFPASHVIVETQRVILVFSSHFYVVMYVCRTLHCLLGCLVRWFCWLLAAPCLAGCSICISDSCCIGLRAGIPAQWPKRVNVRNSNQYCWWKKSCTTWDA